MKTDISRANYSSHREVSGIQYMNVFEDKAGIISLCGIPPQNLAQTFNHIMHSISTFWINVPEVQKSRCLFFIRLTLSSKAFIGTRSPLYRKLVIASIWVLSPVLPAEQMSEGGPWSQLPEF